jgi:hypothetical protein
MSSPTPIKTATGLASLRLTILIFVDPGGGAILPGP